MQQLADHLNVKTLSSHVLQKQLLLSSYAAAQSYSFDGVTFQTCDAVQAFRCFFLLGTVVLHHSAV
jgi:hypothetical protein